MRSKEVIISAMQKEITLLALQQIKPRLAAEGFELHALFGSAARGEQNAQSDIDLLYRITPEFGRRYPGFAAMARVEEIKAELAALLGRPVDLAPVDYLGPIGQKYILPDAVHV